MARDHSAKCEASQTDFFYRQLFITPPATSPSTVNLKGQTGIVTGSNVGLGLECSRQLLSLGLSCLILAVRDESKGETAKAALAAAAPSAEILVWKVDMASYDSILAFVTRCNALPRLDFAVLNAGIFKTSMETNILTGHEAVFQVNYLSTVLLTILLIPVLQNKNTPEKPGRITLVGSETAAWCKFKERDSPKIFAALDDPKMFEMEERYYSSKLLVELFLTRLTQSVPSSCAIVNAVNPGLCYGSNLHHETSGVSGKIFAGIKRAVGREISIGARTLTDGAVNHGSEVHGKYLGDCQVKPMAPLIYTPEGEKIAEKLWDETLAELSSVANVRGIIAGFSK